MSRKHFRILAEAIATINDYRERKRVANLIGKACANTNPNFNWAIWRSACRIVND